VFKTADKRQQSKVQHEQQTLWLLVLFALASGQTNILAIAQWVDNHAQWLLDELGVLTRQGNKKLPSQATLYRFFWALDEQAEMLEQRLQAWTLRVLGECKRVSAVSLDGKVLRGSRRARRGETALSLLSAYLQELGLTLHQEVLTSRESSQAKKLLRHFKALGAFVVTGDAAYADASLAGAVIRAGGDYLLALKSNQPELLELAQWSFSLADCDIDSSFSTSQVRSGELWQWRIETRVVTPELALDFPAARQFVRMQREVFAKATGEVRREVDYAITSLSDEAETLYGFWRGHWSIENSSHHKRDTVFGEDACRSRKAAHALAALRNLLLGLFHLRGQRQVLAQTRRFNAQPHLLLEFFGWPS
jgi:predicted transposase YbfD/YdcC